MSGISFFCTLIMHFESILRALFCMFLYTVRGFCTHFDWRRRVSRYGTETSKIGLPNGRETTRETPPRNQKANTHLLSQIKDWPQPLLLRWAMGNPSVAVWHSHPLSLLSFLSLSVSQYSFQKHFFCPFSLSCVSYLFVCKTN